MSENKYALVNPTNSLRINLMLLDRHKIETDIKISATAHAPSTYTYTEPEPAIDADYMITSQPTLVFHGRQWLKPNKVIDAINQKGIADVPLQTYEVILPSSYDGKRHRTTFSILNTHSRMFKKMVAKGEIPYKRLLAIYNEFMRAIKERTATYKHLKASIMIMSDVNPGRAEMFNKDFVIGLRQPFMQKVFTTQSLWACIDYEAF